MRRITFWIVVIILAVVPLAGLGELGGAQPVQAGGSWSAWLYQYDTGRLVHVFPDGVAPVEMVLPLPPGTSMPPAGVTFSRDGSLLAACLIDDANNASVRVYDLALGAYIAGYPAGGPVEGCGLARYSFGPDGNLLAFGLFNHWPNMSGDARPAWEVTVIDVRANTVVHRLTSDTPSVVAAGITYDNVVPFISAFDTSVIAFHPVYWATEGACEYDSIVWQLDGSNRVDRIGPYGKNDLDLLIPNGEAIWVETNDALPQGTLMGPGCTHNVVMYSNKAGDRFPIFHNGTVLYGSRFIDDGRKVAVKSYTEGGVNQWLYIDRDGSTGGLPGDLRDVWQLWGTMDGYVFLNDAGPTGAPQVSYHRFEVSSAIPQVYVAWTGAPGEYWRIVWVNPLSGGAGLPLFQPVVTMIPTPFPTSFPTAPPPSSGLAIGGQARVFTTAGDLLRVRTGPGVANPIAFQLAPGVTVRIADGPRAADGYTWWQIVSDRGTGWAVEGVMENGVFLQTLIPVP
ncbi:MAG: hypothetical protein JXQ72_13420 [Anaerolineae bacterium]|nr:hypothetical protein [Anaerolineae bacterium]